LKTDEFLLNIPPSLQIQISCLAFISWHPAKVN